MLGRRRLILDGFTALGAVSGDPWLSGCRKRRPAAGFPGFAFVANEGGRSVAAVDLAVFAVARQIPVEHAPRLVLANPGRRRVYVLAAEPAVVYEIAVPELAVTRRLRLGGRARGMRLVPDGTRLYVLCCAPWELVGIDLDRFKRASQVGLGAEPLDFDLSPPGAGAAAVSFGAGGLIALADLKGGRVERTVNLGGYATLVRFRKDGRQLLVADAAGRRLSILSAGGEVLVHLPLAVRPENFCFKADGGQLFITGDGMDAVAVVHPFTTEVAETVLAGKTPGAMAASTNPDYLFVANRASGDVTVLDVETRRVIAVVTVGAEPGSISITPDNQYALVLNRRSGDMAVIRVPSITPRRTKAAALFTMIPVGAAPVSAAVHPA